MNAATAVSTTTGDPQVPPSVQEIPLSQIRESHTNPRRRFDETKLAELAANIRQYGVLQPIVVRTAPSGASDQYELVAGERRYRASKLAGRDSIPATVRELNPRSGSSARGSRKSSFRGTTLACFLSPS